MAETYITSGQNVRINQHCASLASRFIALMIDSVMITVYYICLNKIDQAIHFERLFNYWVFIFLLIAPITFYIPLLETFNNGQTIGKRIVRIRVMRTDGEPLNLGNAALRYLLTPIDLLAGLGIGAILIAVTKRSQRLGDMAAGTVVVHDSSYKQSKVNLNTFNYLLNDYHPLVPRAAELTAQQARTIEHVLNARNKNRQAQLTRLSEKVEKICGKIPSANISPQQYLQQVLNDYRFFQMEDNP